MAQVREAAARQVRGTARRARREAFVLVPLVAAVLFVFNERRQLFGLDLPVRLACSIALVGLGWRFAADVGRAARPALFRRVDPGTAGTFSLVIRLLLLAIAVLSGLQIAGVSPRSLAVGGAFTAVILGIAAQQTLGNVFAGMLLLSARPFRVGDRVRFQAGMIAGQLEGIVESLGLLYVTMSRGDDTILIPNNVAMSAAVVPLREPAAVDLRARLSPDVKPSELQDYLSDKVQTPTRSRPHINVEEVDEEEVVMRIEAIPAHDHDGPQLADEILAVIGAVTRSADGDGATAHTNR